MSPDPLCAGGVWGRDYLVVVAAGLVSPEWAIFSFPAQLGFVRKYFVHLVSGLILVL